MKTVIYRIGRYFLLAVPLVVGMIGFVLVEKLPVLQSLFNCVCMYCLNYQEQPQNYWIEIARWLAPLATASGIALVFQHFRSSLRNIQAYCTGCSTAVYGPDEERSVLMEELGSSGIPLDEKFVKAHRYVLLGSEKDNLDFYQEHYGVLSNRDVYVKCHDVAAHASTNAKLHLFCPEETAARIFWKRYSPYSVSVDNNHRFNIVMIGFGKLGRELLLYGLQYNIFHRDQHIAYHIIGQEDGFKSIYHQLDQMSDAVEFHSGVWYENMDLIRDAQMVIVVDQKNQLSILSNLSLALPNQALHILTVQQRGIELLQAQNSNVHTFDWQVESRKKDAIIGSALYDLAMRINLRYAHLYNGVEETEINKIREWEKLDAFTRYSNISPADYHDICRMMIECNGWTLPLTAEQKELFAELEHIRWCRYHFLNNWKYGIPKNGKAKDPVLRIHHSLVEYCKLSEEEKDKDRQVLDILFSLTVSEQS